MRGGERVVDVTVGQLGELAREAVVVLLFLGMEAEIFEQQQLAGFDRLRLRARGLADAVGRQRDRAREQLAQPFGHGLERQLRVGPALGTTEMRGEHDGGAAIESQPERGNHRAQPGVVGDGSPVEGRVEVGADE